MAEKPKMLALDLEWKDRGVTNRRAFGINPAADDKIFGEFSGAAEVTKELGSGYDIIGDREWIKEQAGKILRGPQVWAEICKLFDANTQISLVEIHFFDGESNQLVRYEVRRQNDSGPLEIIDEEQRALDAAGEWIKRETPTNSDMNSEPSAIAPKNLPDP